jgi:ankyrin repeat protein
MVWAAKMGHTDMVEELIRWGGYSDEWFQKDALLPWPLALAAGEGHTEVVKLLAALKANLESRDDAGKTPFARAAQNWHIETVRALLELGADKETREDKHGMTPLALAAESGMEGSEEIVTILLDNEHSWETKTHMAGRRYS